MDNKCQRYFNSTPNRNTFDRLMVLALLDDTPLCLSEMLAKNMYLSQDGNNNSRAMLRRKLVFNR